MNNIKCFISTLLLMLLAAAFVATTVDVYASTYAVTVPGPDECEASSSIIESRPGNIAPRLIFPPDRPGDPPNIKPPEK